MNEETQRLIRKRRMIGRISGALLAVCLLCILDGLTASWRTPFNTISTVVGQSFSVNGPMPKGAANLSDLRVHGASGQTWRFKPEKVYKGFWFGGLMWKGLVTVSPQAPAGAYPLVVRGPGKEPPNPMSRFTIRVHSDTRELRRHDASFTMRLSGLRPFMAAWLLFIAALLTGGGGYLLSRKITEQYRQDGKADIFLVERKPEGVFVNFSLGRDCNVEPGMDVAIQNEDGETLYRAVVAEVKQFDSKALVSEGPGKVRPGMIAQILKP
ncbi:MAG: hypothetical protein HZB23_05200 [Deltaproteobacteria bacterium]|nr:hypothetical protein [Deltaproteobacteria bacterium]